MIRVKELSGIVQCISVAFRVNLSCLRVYFRPDVVLFGESLPDNFWSKSRTDFSDCDLLIVLGTSLSVAPFNSLVAK